MYREIARFWIFAATSERDQILGRAFDPLHSEVARTCELRKIRGFLASLLRLLIDSSPSDPDLSLVSQPASPFGVRAQ